MLSLHDALPIYPVLMARLAELLPPLRTATDAGLDADAKEAYLFALLGYLSVHGLPGTASADPADPDGPRATGARLPAVLGSLTPPVPVPGTTAGGPVRSEARRVGKGRARGGSG